MSTPSAATEITVSLNARRTEDPTCMYLGLLEYQRGTDRNSRSCVFRPYGLAFLFIARETSCKVGVRLSILVLPCGCRRMHVFHFGPRRLSQKRICRYEYHSCTR